MVSRQDKALDNQTDVSSLFVGLNETDVEAVRALLLWRQQQDADDGWHYAAGVALLVTQLQLDTTSLLAALLLGAPVEDAPASEEAKKLAQEIGRLENFAELLDDSVRKDGRSQAENLRQMLLAMVGDIRVVLIALAERLYRLRLSLQQPDIPVRHHLAREVHVLFAPLANRLGIWQFKWEMEDLAYRILEPDNYRQIARLLDEKRLDRERYIEQVVQQLSQGLAQEGLRAEVSGRPKHIVSIINKMHRKHLDFEQLYDIRAVRILVPELKDCYWALGLVHQWWQPIAGEFDDYIAQPKANNYQSLHTGVIGPENKPLEIQIRTFAMHEYAELGVAAHWRYKENGQSSAPVDKIAWLRQILRWKDEVSDEGALAELFRNELFQDRVYVLTPQGRVIDLEAGASPLDFAYHVHTDLGHRCRGARVDGAMVPLHTPLKNGQRVEILTVKQGSPSRDWLNPALGYLRTARARAKVRHWFRVEQFDAHVALGRELLARELRRLRIHEISHERLAGQLQFARSEEMFAALGRGELSLQQIEQTLRKMDGLLVTPPVFQPRVAVHVAGALPKVTVAGVTGLPVTLARCCHPVSSDSIVAYATQTRGMTIHRADCASVTRLDAERRERLLPAAWQ